MEVEPNRVVQTSPETLAEEENTFIRRYPTASAPTEIMAMAASPLIFAFCPVRNSKMAKATVTSRIKGMSSVKPATAATAMAPKATWDRPSPIKE